MSVKGCLAPAFLARPAPIVRGLRGIGARGAMRRALLPCFGSATSINRVEGCHSGGWSIIAAASSQPRSRGAVGGIGEPVEIACQAEPPLPDGSREKWALMPVA